MNGRYHPEQKVFLTGGSNRSEVCRRFLYGSSLYPTRKEAEAAILDRLYKSLIFSLID